MKDTLIIEHLRRGDEEAFKYIYEHHYVLLCRFANQILNDRRPRLVKAPEENETEDYDFLLTI